MTEDPETRLPTVTGVPASGPARDDRKVVYVQRPVKQVQAEQASTAVRFEKEQAPSAVVDRVQVINHPVGEVRKDPHRTVNPLEREAKDWVQGGAMMIGRRGPSEALRFLVRFVLLWAADRRSVGVRP